MIVNIHTEYIKLDSFMKLSSLAMTGGEAKEMILAGRVKVNGTECFARGKKLYPGYTVQLDDGDIFTVGSEEK